MEFGKGSIKTVGRKDWRERFTIGIHRKKKMFVHKTGTKFGKVLRSQKWVQLLGMKGNDDDQVGEREVYHSHSYLYINHTYNR